MTILIKFLLAHVIADFFLQPLSWIKDKEKYKIKSAKLYIHIAIHLIALFVVVWDFSLWLPIILITISHFIIDTAKIYLQKKKFKRFIFFMDQLLHLLVIVVIYWVNEQKQLEICHLITEDNLLLILCLLLLIFPASISIQTIFLKWDLSVINKGGESLIDAGKYIGIIERILVFIFIIINQWEAVGFLITAKSVFRIGDLRKSKQIRLTEYILIGTLLSFSIAIFTALAYLYLSGI